MGVSRCEEATLLLKLSPFVTCPFVERCVSVAFSCDSGWVWTGVAGTAGAAALRLPLALVTCFRGGVRSRPARNGEYSTPSALAVARVRRVDLTGCAGSAENSLERAADGFTCLPLAAFVGEAAGETAEPPARVRLVPTMMILRAVSNALARRDATGRRTYRTRASLRRVQALLDTAWRVRREDGVGSSW